MIRAKLSLYLACVVATCNAANHTTKAVQGGAVLLEGLKEVPHEAKSSWWRLEDKVTIPVILGGNNYLMNNRFTMVGRNLLVVNLTEDDAGLYIQKHEGPGNSHLEYKVHLEIVTDPIEVDASIETTNGQDYIIEVNQNETSVVPTNNIPVSLNLHNIKKVAAVLIAFILVLIVIVVVVLTITITRVRRSREESDAEDNHVQSSTL